MGIVVGIDPNGPLPGPPFKTKRDSCERDRFDGMLLKKIVFFFFGRNFFILFTEVMERFVDYL